MLRDLFSDESGGLPKYEFIARGALLLPGFALDEAQALMHSLQAVLARAPLRHLETPGGRRMSVASSSCGKTGWGSDRAGYRYAPIDPQTGLAWPPMPLVFFSLAGRAAAEAGYADFEPDTCLINRYAPGARLTLHQDRNERDYTAPIVSVSLGVTADFLFGGQQRSERTLRMRLESGDVVVWGGASRLAFHGIAPLGDSIDPLTGRCRINLTFRKAL